MLPGFRFLFAAVILSMSVLIFGLGAAALLRAAHEEFASMPSRRGPAEQVFARQHDAPPPTLALLRFEPPAPDKPFVSDKPFVADKPLDVPETAAAATVAPAGPTLDAAAAEPEKLAALKPAEPVRVETAKPEISASETTVATAAVPAEAETPLAKEEIKVAAILETPAPSIGTAPVTPAPSVAAPTTDAPTLESKVAATRIATLGGPAVIIDEKTSASTTDAKPGRSIVRKRSAERARERRRVAARRARLARQAAAAQQQQASPFGQTASGRATQ